MEFRPAQKKPIHLQVLITSIFENARETSYSNSDRSFYLPSDSTGECVNINSNQNDPNTLKDPAFRKFSLTYICGNSTVA